MHSDFDVLRSSTWFLITRKTFSFWCYVQYWASITFASIHTSIRGIAICLNHPETDSLKITSSKFYSAHVYVRYCIRFLVEFNIQSHMCDRNEIDVLVSWASPPKPPSARKPHFTGPFYRMRHIYRIIWERFVVFCDRFIKCLVLNVLNVISNYCKPLRLSNYRQIPLLLSCNLFG